MYIDQSLCENCFIFFSNEIVLCGASNSDLLMSFIVSDSRIVALFSAVYILEQEGLVFLDES